MKPPVSVMTVVRMQVATSPSIGTSRPRSRCMTTLPVEHSALEHEVELAEERVAEVMVDVEHVLALDRRQKLAGARGSLMSQKT